MNDGWTYTEKVCYIAHIWADKEKGKDKEVLQDFDYTEMAIVTDEFISGFSTDMDFREYVDLCFDNFVKKCEEEDSAAAAEEAAANV